MLDINRKAFGILSKKESSVLHLETQTVFTAINTHLPRVSIKMIGAKAKDFFFSAARSTDGQKYKTKACMRFSSVLQFSRMSTQEKCLRELR